MKSMINEKDTLLVEVIYNFDVWGNEEDGWDVNDCMRLAPLRIARWGNWEQDIWEAARLNLISSEGWDKLEMLSWGGWYTIQDKTTGKPYFDLHPYFPEES